MKVYDKSVDKMINEWNEVVGLVHRSLFRYGILMSIYVYNLQVCQWKMLCPTVHNSGDPCEEWAVP